MSTPATIENAKVYVTTQTFTTLPIEGTLPSTHPTVVVVKSHIHTTFLQHKFLGGNSPSWHTLGLQRHPGPLPLTLFFTHGDIVVDGTLVAAFWCKVFGVYINATAT
ncbi:unnamed protein product [Sphenostylis stenocarpa]|uniref:Uncharacterized protein n=1 Tax=Sphenostylis stenocarpa TaxID=92480 RepID=A0AA86STF5_9FABA|nr:unnamed protein product [Sphenostylis stenocarpa]